MKTFTNEEEAHRVLTSSTMWLHDNFDKSTDKYRFYVAVKVSVDFISASKYIMQIHNIVSGAQQCGVYNYKNEEVDNYIQTMLQVDNQFGCTAEIVESHKLIYLMKNRELLRKILYSYQYIDKFRKVRFKYNSKLTKKDNIVNFVLFYREQNNCGPTYKDIAANCHLSSISSVYLNVQQLVEQGRLKLEDGFNNSLDVVKEYKNGKTKR